MAKVPNLVELREKINFLEGQSQEMIKTLNNQAQHISNLTKLILEMHQTLYPEMYKELNDKIVLTGVK